jgi:NHLM bacteriocin system ABC transporter peptidase/ATP-binding protein
MGWVSRLMPGRRSARRAKTPRVLQMEAVECGAAALGIVLGYYGRFVSLEELRVECGISRDGSKASSIIKVARDYGLEAKGFRKAVSELKVLPVPMIVFWEYNHFLVVEGFGEDRVYLNDPAMGPYYISPEEFEASYSGIVLIFEIGPEFQKGGKRHRVLVELIRHLHAEKPALVYAVLAGLGLIIPGILAPTFSRIFVDEYLVEGLEYWVKPLLLFMAGAAVLQAALTWLQQRCLLHLEVKLAVKMSGQFLWHILRLPVEFFTQRYAGDVASRVAVNDRLARLISGDLATNFLGLMALVFLAGLMALYDVRLTLVVITVALLNLVALKYVSAQRKDLNLRLMKTNGKLMGTSMNGLQMIESLKASGAESAFFSRWAGYQAKMIEVHQQFGAYGYYLAAVPPLLTALNSALVIGLGGLLIMNGHITMGMLVAFQSFMMAFITPLNNLVGLGAVLQEADGDIRWLEDIMHYPPDVELGDAQIRQEKYPPKLSGHLELRNVTFGYNRLTPQLIEKFSMKLRPGSRVALVGASGSGKSTISRLVCGLYEPWEGEVLLDGHPRRDLPRRLITRSLAMVDQTIMIFEGTVRDNLTLWDNAIPEEDLIQAAKDALIYQELMSRPGAYNYKVEEGGGNFSGGQRQRLEIARALAVNPTLLVLDEATSALDPVTEELIDNNLRRRGLTCLIIAHRLSTIRDCDEIIVLDQGKVVQRGRHQELKDQDGLYSNLIQAE